MKKLLFGLVLVFLKQSLPAQDLKNLKVLPFKTKKETMAYMKKIIAPSVGEKCSFCHNTRNFASDDNEKKKITREMIIMTQNMNKDTMKKLDYKPITCWTCHRGSTNPPRVENEKKKDAN
tara:strand:+ start:99 stop:458 length:360 start_codon:yes stop_codon:yes gene_type:complete